MGWLDRYTWRVNYGLRRTGGRGKQAGPSVARTLWRAGCLFNSKAGIHGRDARATTEGRTHQTCDSPQRTHRFSQISSTEDPTRKVVTAKIYDEFRWVRFGKRTHRGGILAG